MNAPILQPGTLQVGQLTTPHLTAPPLLAPRMLRIEFKGQTFDWLKLDEAGSGIDVHSEEFVKTLRQNIWVYFKVPLELQLCRDEDGPLITWCDFARVLQNVNPVIRVFDLREMLPDMRAQMGQKVALMVAEALRLQRFVAGGNSATLPAGGGAGPPVVGGATTVSSLPGCPNVVVNSGTTCGGPPPYMIQHFQSGHVPGGRTPTPVVVTSVLPSQPTSRPVTPPRTPPRGSGCMEPSASSTLAETLIFNRGSTPPRAQQRWGVQQSLDNGARVTPSRGTTPPREPPPVFPATGSLGLQLSPNTGRPAAPFEPTMVPVSAQVPTPSTAIPFSAQGSPTTTGWSTSRADDPPTEVHLSKARVEDMFGFQISPTVDNRAALISYIDPDSILSRWNWANPALAVREGDMIVSVNGVSDNVEAMKSQMQQFSIVMRVQRR